jgi:hypothetical protein
MTSQYGSYALHAGLVRLNVRMRIRTPAHPVTHMHTQTSNTYCFSKATMTRKRASMLRYMYLASLVTFGKGNTCGGTVWPCNSYL